MVIHPFLTQYVLVTKWQPANGVWLVARLHVSGGVVNFHRHQSFLMCALTIYGKIKASALARWRYRLIRGGERERYTGANLRES